MTEQKDYYKILGLKRDATKEDIRKAYREACLKHHPDRHVSDGPEEQKKFEALFKDDAEAYTVLSDPEKKRNYDTYGNPDGPTGTMGGDPFSGFNPFSGFGGFNPFGGFRKREPVKEIGKDLRISLNLTIDELFTGVHKKIRIKKDITCHRCHGSGSETNETETCPYCHGTGMIVETKQTGLGIMQSQTVCPHCHGTGTIIKDPCPNCHGTGLEESMEEVEFDVPAGMFDNSYFVVDGQGSMGPHRGVPGKLVVFVKESPNGKGLTRDENNNVYVTVKAEYTDLIFGKEIEVPYIIGYKKIELKPSTQSGEKIIMTGLGMPDPNGSSYTGNFIITVECEIPKPDKLSSEKKELLKKLKTVD